jgi:hypothetical protein
MTVSLSTRVETVLDFLAAFEWSNVSLLKCEWARSGAVNEIRELLSACKKMEAEGIPAWSDISSLPTEREEYAVYVFRNSDGAVTPLRWANGAWLRDYGFMPVDIREFAVDWMRLPK